MSRSKRKTPVRGISSAESEKSDKKASHRKLRRSVRQVVSNEEAIIPLEKELTNSWTMPKDGKSRFNPNVHPKLMRK